MTGTGSAPRARASRLSHARRARWFLTAGIAIVAVIGTAVVLLRPDPTPYTPGLEAATSDEITSRLARELPPQAPRIRFSEAGEQSGLRFRHFPAKRSTQLPEDMGSGAAWGDYDGDGDPDLYLVNESGPLSRESPAAPAAPAARSALYRNDSGRFTDVTVQAGVGADGLGMGAAWGDYDGDGDLDLAVTRFGTSLLYRNDGGVFKDVSKASLIGSENGFWTGASWGDFDRDGDLDLYVCGYVAYEQDPESAARTSYQYGALIPYTLNPSSYAPERNLLFRNDGGVFREVARAAGVDNLAGRSLSAAWCDFDGDGWPDLYVANDISDNAMYRNRGDGTFDDVSHEAWVADHRGAMGLAAGDWDNDGDFDLFITHWIAQENALYENQNEKMPPGGGQPTRFIDQADMIGLGQIALDYIGWGTTFFDYDNDGRLDLFVANGSTFQDEEDPSRLVPMRNLLFWNGGPDKGYFETGQLSPDAIGARNVGRGAAAADYDGDGDLDLVVMAHGAGARLFRNEGRDRGGSVRVVLRGAAGAARGSGRPATARFAEATIVKVESAGAKQIRQVGAISSYLSQEPPGEVHFGLGGAPAIDRLEILWPSGRTQTLGPVPAGSIVTLVEGGRPVIVPRGGGPPAPGASTAGSGRGSQDVQRVVAFWRVFHDATSLRMKGDCEAAAARYEEALELDPEHEDSLYYLGQCRRELARFGPARDSFARLVEVNPASARGHLALGALLASSDEGAPLDLQSAEAHLRRAHDINKEETGPMVRLGEVLLVSRRTGEARSWLESAAATNAKSVEAAFLLSYMAWKDGDREGARGWFARAVRAAATDAPVRGVLNEGDRVVTPARESGPAKAVVAAPPLRAPMGRTMLGGLADPLRHLAASGGAVEPTERELSETFGRVDSQVASLARRSAASL